MNKPGLEFAHRSSFIAHCSTSTVFAVEQILHGFAAGGIGASVGLERVAGFGARTGRIFLAARRAAVGETGLARFQFEFFATNGTDFDWKCHDSNPLTLRSEGNTR